MSEPCDVFLSQPRSKAIGSATCSALAMMRRHIQISQCREKNWVMIAAPMKQLAEFGYVEGQNIVFEYRWSDQAQQLPTLAPS